ncbi:hypothetical protein BJY00DRAFT_141029 [Aspergillus carlsbadensis]|nr:hypothetical protein BJY00DRAFT_141029 [Aspergillus carlsbadensis]
MTLTHEDYTVGWICALPRELAAARGMLDEEHEVLPAESIDCNAYTLGRIGSHNVVLACLPVGETGVVPAALTVMRMKSTFRCLEIGLVVGVGGGVPSETHDIRLGDVVVGDGGVSQYNMGKTVQGGRFICSQDRLRPPQRLLLAVSKIQAGNRLGKQKMDEYVDDMTSRHPDFSHPGVESDILYATCYDHPQETVSCAQCDPTQRVLRAPRQSIRPAVHYGLIASGNQRTQHDILCFEMEAAGLMREFPSLVIRGICDYADSHKNKAWQDYAAVTAAAYAKELLTIMPGALSRPTGKCFMVPFPSNPNFVGRKDILAMIDNKLQGREMAVLAGIGGVGKTQLAVEFCYSFRQKVPAAHVFWVNASTSSSFEQSYSEIARALRIAGHDDPRADLRPQIHAHLSRETTGRWLMVLDNFDDGQELAPQMAFVPSPRVDRGSIIVTTRDMRVTQHLPHWDNINDDVVEIPPLEIVDARSLVEAVLRPEQRANKHDIQALLEMLGCFPLALTQALSFIKHNRTTITNYRSLLNQGGESGSNWLRDVEYPDIRRYNGIPTSVFRTWEISFRKVQQSDAPAANLLARISVFDAPLGVPEILLHPKDYNAVEFTTALGTLLSFSMATLGPDGSITMHATVQQAVRGFVTSQGTREAYLLEASNRIAGEFVIESVASARQLEQLVAHADEVLRYTSKIGPLREETLLSRATLLDKMARHRIFCSRDDLALVHAEEAYAMRRQTLGETHPDTIRSLELITSILIGQRKYEAAEINQHRVVETRQSLGPSGDPRTLESQWILVGTLTASGQLTKALELCDRLKLRHQAADPLCSDGPAALYLVAHGLHSTGRQMEAERVYRRILAELEGDPDMDERVLSRTRVGLDALLRVASADTRVSENFANRLRVCFVVFGTNHPATIRALRDLASVYDQQGKVDAAEELQGEAYRISVEVLSDNHPETLACLSSLANIKSRKGQFTQAEELYRRICHQQSMAVGPTHPSALTSMNSLARVLIELNNYADARGLLKQVTDFGPDVCGQTSPVRLDAIESLLVVLPELGELEEAERLCLETIKLLQEDVPTDDVKVAVHMGQLATILEAQGRLSEAESHHREAVRLNADRDASLAVTSCVAVGLLLHKQDRPGEAAGFYRQALEAGQNTGVNPELMGTISQALERALYEEKQAEGVSEIVQREHGNDDLLSSQARSLDGKGKTDPKVRKRRAGRCRPQ